MKRIIMRAMWGMHDKSHRVLRRKDRVNQNIKFFVQNQYQDEYYVICWGSENEKFLKDLGIKNIHLVSQKPYQWDLVDYQFRHKLEALRICMEVDGYDEIVHADFDCILVKPFPVDFWESFKGKESLQACLEQKKRIRCPYRGETDIRKVPNGGFVYINDKTIPQKLIDIWGSPANPIKRSAEPTLAYYIDDREGKWIGCEEYFKRYEPMQCELQRNGVYGKKGTKQNNCYLHFAGLNKINKDMI